MRLLKIRAEGLPLYKNPFEVSFFAMQRVESSHLDAVSKLFGSIYVNKAEAFTGINASGKTTALNVVAFVFLLLKGVPLKIGVASQILRENQAAVFDVDFFAGGRLYHLKSKIIKEKNASGEAEVRILEEKLWEKAATGRVSKRNLLDFESARLSDERTDDKKYLSSDVSIAIALSKADRDDEVAAYLSVFAPTDIFIPNDSVPSEIISLLDPTIEYIKEESVNEKSIIRLKFFGQDELTLTNRTDLRFYLSSGTLKGVTIFSQAIEVLKHGGYLFLDEIENSFNRELVVSLLRLFLDGQTNPKGAVIVFSTHYAELLDELARNDSIFITKNSEGLTVDNLNDLLIQAGLNRNDLKRSDVYQSNILGGTAPKYNALDALRKSIVERMEG